MAKQAYRIPATLADNYWNMDIAIQSKDGVGLKPLPMRVIIAWLVSLLLLVYIDVRGGSIIVEAGAGIRILFAIVWIAFTFIMTKTDGTKRMQLELIPALINYLQKTNRHVLTRRAVNAAPFYGIVGIKDISSDGVINYLDGTYARWYSVIGTASVLLFPTDRDLILDHADDFYRKMQSDCELIFMTTKEPQRVGLQLAHLISQFKHRKYDSPGLASLVEEQKEALQTFVGKEFKSIHQYMIIKGDNKEALSQMDAVIASEAANSQYFFKKIELMSQNDIERVLRLIYADV